MSKRKEHVFRFTAKQIAEAATVESKYHSERAAWWNAEYEKAAAEAKAKGVEIRHYQVTGGVRPQVTIDASVSNRLEEAARKRTDHTRQADQFKVEAATYGSQPADLQYDLDGEDVMHFRLAGGEREEEKPLQFV
jgi:hypothetical protein